MCIDRNRKDNNIFISYTVRDGCITQSKLYDLCNALSCYGFVYADVLHNDSTDPQRRVEDELLAADLVVFLKTEAFYTSEWVQREKRISQEHNKVTIMIDVEMGAPWGYTIALVKREVYNKIVQPTHEPDACKGVG